MPEPYDKEERSIPAYNPHNDYGLDDFDKDYIGHGGSREGVNDETSHYNGMESDPSKGGHSGSLPSVFSGPNRDTCEDDAINKLAVSGRSLKPKEIMVDMQVEHGLGLLYSKALRAKELAEQNVFSPPDLSYQLLPAYCHQLKLVNPEQIQKPLCNLFHEASRAYQQSKFLEKMQELRRVNKRAYEYLMRVGPYRWSLVYCPVRRYRGMTSNIVECMNNCLRYARQLPIATLEI
ncbi:hypothetical protein QYF36_022272 [Acer negundo]|nr:hypothetical protein QYF36_022272 [Acer negundo]